MKYVAAQSAILELIARDGLVEGDRLPNEIDLSQCCGVSTITTRRALRELGRLGIIDRQQGRGTFVKRHPARGQRVGTVAYLVAGTEPALYERMLGQAQRALLERGYGLRHLAALRPDDQTARELSDVSGVLITGAVTDEWVWFLESVSLPFVVLGSCEAQPVVWRVDYNWDQAVSLLVHELVRRGCRRMGLLNGAHRYPPARQAYAAYRRELSEAGIAPDDKRVVWSKRGEYAERIEEFFARNPDPLDALIVEHGVLPHLLVWFYARDGASPRPVIASFSDHPRLLVPYDNIIEASFAVDPTQRGVERLFEVMGSEDGRPNLLLLEPRLCAGRADL